MPRRKDDFADDILKRRFKARTRTVKPRKQRAKFSRRDGKARVHLRRQRRPTPVTCLRDDNALPPLPHPQLVFERERPECTWIVPALKTPLYYFDEWMLRMQLVIFKQPDTFIVPGGACDRVFKLVARQQVARTYWHRYLVVELRPDLPHRGLP